MNRRSTHYRIADKRARNQALIARLSTQDPASRPTFCQVAKELGISRQRAHQIWKRHLEKSTTANNRTQ